MPWSIPIAILTNRLNFTDTFSSNQQELNLWDYFGNPSDPSDVSVTFSSSLFIDTLFIGNFAPGSIITIGVGSNTTFRGRGGSGGNGGESFFEGLLGQCVGFGAQSGGAGSASIILPGTGITVNIDLDSAFSWGGGGGGGGGAAQYGVTCNQGGGGGGAQGWDVNAGGFSYAPATSGGSGNSAGPGTGGSPSGGTAGAGGDGGAWGTAGDTGLGVGGAIGGVGGRAIQVPASDTLVLSGAKNQATLESEGRLLGRNGDPIGA